MNFTVQSGVKIKVVNLDGRTEEKTTTKVSVFSEDAVETAFEDGAHCKLPDNSAGWSCMIVPFEAIQAVDVGVAPKLETIVPKSPEHIPDGTYTVVETDDSYVTVQIKTVKEEFKDPAKRIKNPFWGKRIVSYLSGPDNTTDFEGFAFMNGTKLRLWKRFLDGAFPSEKIAKYVSAITVIARSDDKQQYGEAYAMRSKKCSKCNRDLTVPTSLHRGMGPVCAKGGEDS